MFEAVMAAHFLDEVFGPGDVGAPAGHGHLPGRARRSGLGRETERVENALDLDQRHGHPEQALDVAVAGGGWGPEASASASALSVAGRLRDLQRDVQRLSRWNDPRGVYAHCLCGDE